MNKLVTLINHKDNSTEQYRINWPVESLERLAQDIAYCIALFTNYSFDYRNFSNYKDAVKHLHLYKKAIFQEMEMSLTDVRDTFTGIKIEQAIDKPYLFKRIEGLDYELEESFTLPLPVTGTDSEALSRVLLNFINTTYYNDENSLRCVTDIVNHDVSLLAELLIVKKTLDLSHFKITLLENK